MLCCGAMISLRSQVASSACFQIYRAQICWRGGDCIFIAAAVCALVLVLWNAENFEWSKSDHS